MSLLIKSALSAHTRNILSVLVHLNVLKDETLTLRRLCAQRTNRLLSQFVVNCLPAKEKFECVEMLWLQQLNVLNGLLLLLRHTETAMSVLGKSILTFIFITKGTKKKRS